MFDTTVTVFNRYYSKQLDKYTWYPHVIHNCYFNADKAANIEKTGLADADSATLHIPFSFEDGKTMIGDLEYMDPIKWEKQPNDTYRDIITFSEGKDFFLIGEYSDVAVPDTDYMTGGVLGFKDYMKRNFDHVYTINSAGKYSLIPHFELRGS
jgi:hypothetical protein